jgi:hypothetical protein
MGAWVEKRGEKLKEFYLLDLNDVSTNEINLASHKWQQQQQFARTRRRRKSQSKLSRRRRRRQKQDLKQKSTSLYDTLH